MIIIPKKKFI